MGYVAAGYTFILVVLAAYAVALVWRRHRLTQAVDRAVGPPAPSPAGRSTGVSP